MSPILTSIIVIGLLILLNAFFAAAEIAVISVRETRIRPLAENGSTAAVTLLQFLKDPSRFLATIQIGVTLAGFFASATAAAALSDNLSRFLQSIGISSGADTISIVIITLAVAYLTLVFGELAPKRVALARAEQISFIAARPIELLSIIAGPLTHALTFSTNAVVRLFGIRPEDTMPGTTEEELKLLVSQHSALLEEEKKIIAQAFEFGDIIVRQIMVPRTDIAAVKSTSTVKDALEKTKESGHPRLLVFGENLDEIEGAIHLKDMIVHIEAGDLSVEVSKLMRRVIYVPETHRAISLLADLQKSGLHMAVVLDEYGGTSGIITTEDIAEEIVGEFGERHEEEELVKSVRGREIIIDGRLPIGELNERFGLEIPESPEYDTVAGWILSELRYIPKPGEKLIYNKTIFEVRSVQQNRVALVRIIRRMKK